MEKSGKNAIVIRHIRHTGRPQAQETQIIWTERKPRVSPSFSIFDLRKSRPFPNRLGLNPRRSYVPKVKKLRRPDHCWFFVTVIVAKKWQETYSTILVLFQRLELLRNKLRFTWDRAEVLPTDHIVQILNGAAWPEVFSMSLLGDRASG